MKKIVLIIVIVGVIMTLTACKQEKNIEKNIEKRELEEIIVDVRTKEEYESSHIVNSINIPYDTIDENVDLDKTKTIKVYCQSGKRSQIAYQKLTELGYNVIDLGSIDNIDLEKEP